MTDEQRTLHHRALMGAATVVALVTDADLVRPTPCAAWDLADLLAHMVGQHRGFAACARDGDAPESAYAPVPFHPETWDASVEELFDAFAALDPEARLVEVELSPHPLPAQVVVGAQLLDSAVHAWDVARTLGLDHVPDPDVVAVTLAVAEGIPDDERREREGSAFARSLPDDGDDPWARSLALLGRDPAWVRPGPAPIVGG